MRDAGDIDLLVAEKDIFAAGEILRGEGYVRFEPRARLTPRRLQSYIAHQKDFSYDHSLAGVAIDLHWRLFRNPFLPANANLAKVGEDWIYFLVPSASRPCPHRGCCFISACMERWTAGCVSNGWRISPLFCAS